MGAAGYQLNKKINNTVAYKKAQRPSPSAIQNRNVTPIKEEVVDLNASPFASTIGSPSIGLQEPIKVMGSREKPTTTNIADIAARLEAEAPAKARTGMDLYSEFDPNRGAMQGYNVESYNREVNVERPLLQAFKDLEIPAYKEFDVPELDTGGLDYDKTKLYTNYGKRGQLEFPNEAARQEYYEKERTGTFHDVSELLGLNPELGQQTMVWVKNPPEPSKWEKFLGNPVLQVVGLLHPPVALATTGAKLASGVDVSPVELASSLMTGLEMTGAVKAPVNAGKFDSTKLAGPVAPTGSTAGTGLFGTSYNQTKTALNVAAAGDAKGAAIALVGDNIIKGGLEKAGLDQAAIERAGIQYDDFEAGVGKTVQKLAAGEELDEALAHGLGKYIREGGTLGSIDLPETNIDLGVIEDVVRDVVRPIGKVGTALAHAVEDGAQAIGDATRPIIKAIEKPLKPIGDVIEDVGQVTGDVVEDVAQVTGDIVEDVAQESGDVIEDVAQATGDVLSDLDTAIRQALPDIDLPDVDLPSIDLPSIDLPFELRPSLMSDTGGDFIPSPTRTTDSLFNDELFQFETEIGISDYPIETQEELELFYPESALQLDYGRDPDNFFENTIYEAKPRSYIF